MIYRIPIVASGWLLITCALTQARPAPAFYNIGVIPNSGDFPSSGIDGMSPDASVFVGDASTPARPDIVQPAKWTPTGGLVSLGFDPTYFGGYGRDASIGGGVITGYRQLTGNLHYRGYRYANGVYTDLGDLPGGTDNTLALGISYDGNTITGLGNFNDGAHGDLGFTWTPTTGIRALPLLPGYIGSQALDISGDGKVVVGGVSDNVFFGPAVRWTDAEGMVSLGKLAGGELNGAGNAVNFDGSAIVGTSQINSTLEACRWTDAGGMIGLGDLPGGAFRSVANDLSDDGQIVIGYSTTGIAVGVGEESFIWDAAHGMRNLAQVLTSDYELNLNGMTLTRANAISADGTVIAGSGYDPQGRYLGWVAVIPEPSGMGAAISIGLVASNRRRLR